MSAKKILIIDDSETSLLLFKSLFEDEEIAIYSEINSKQAIHKIKEIMPDIIVLDLMMPEIDGFHLLKTIKSEDGMACIPVIILSAIHDNKTIDKVMQLGASLYIKKPFIIDEVIKIMIKQLSLVGNINNAGKPQISI